MIFEEIGDYFNVKLSEDISLPHIVRQLNSLHHMDESRHLAMGRRLLERKYTELREDYDQATLSTIENYLKRYIVSSIESFYSPAVYKDARIKAPYELRRTLLGNERRREYHKIILSRVLGFLYKSGIFIEKDFLL
jgi:hypothetical protein